MLLQQNNQLKPSNEFNIVSANWKAQQEWGMASVDSSNKDEFYDLLNKAIKPELIKDETLERKRPDDYTEKQTRSSKTANTSLKQRDESQK